MARRVLRVFPEGGTPSFAPKCPIAAFEFCWEMSGRKFLPPAAVSEFIEIADQNFIKRLISQVPPYPTPILFEIVVFHVFRMPDDFFLLRNCSTLYHAFLIKRASFHHQQRDVVTTVYGFS